MHHSNWHTQQKNGSINFLSSAKSEVNLSYFHKSVILNSRIEQDIHHKGQPRIYKMYRIYIIVPLLWECIHRGSLYFTRCVTNISLSFFSTGSISTWTPYTPKSWDRVGDESYICVTTKGREIPMNGPNVSNLYCTSSSVSNWEISVPFIEFLNK